MVYFVQPIDGGPIKIGCSRDVPTRIQQLESHYGCRLALLATMEGGRSEERAIHERFAHLRFGRTEQFQPGPDLMDFIGRPLFAAAGNVVEPMESKRRDVPTRIHEDALFVARIAAAYKRMSLVEYISEALRVAADRDIREACERRLGLEG